VGAEAIDEATSLLTRRLRIALVGSVGPILLFALADLRLVGSALGWVYAVKLLAVGVLAAALWVLRVPRRRATVVLVALMSASLLFALSTASALLGAEPNTAPLLTITVALATATLLPWGGGAQVLLVSVAAGAMLVTVYQITGSLGVLISYPNVGVAIGLGVSIFIAYELERSRALLAYRRREQQRAEAEVRTLNAELEARVAQRTAELERLNTELQREVASHRLTEAELRRSEAVWSALVENTDAGIWSVDRTYRLMAFNSVVSRRFHQMSGRPFDPGQVPQTPSPRWRALYDRALAGEHFRVEQEAELDGEARLFLTSFAPIVSGGAVTGVTVFSADITERKRAEDAARQRQAELTHVLRLGTMGEMAAGLAHEINQPLGAIANFAQGCSRRLRAGNGDPADLLHVIDQIAVEAIRAAEIIRRLRSLIRKEEPRREWIDLYEIAADALRLLSAETRQSGVTSSVEGAPGQRAYADPIQIEQVLLNLLRNGVEAMEGRINGRRELSVRFVTAGDTVEVAVSDTGRGLPTAAAHVFDPFFSTKPGGLGMGLSISRSIIEAHGGLLWATANPEGGTTFRFTLPIDRVELAANGAERRQAG
jgi:PAS domain S-box-containing protein